MEDIRLGRTSGGNAKTRTTSAGGAEQFVSADDHRVRLIVSIGLSGNVTIGPASLPPATGIGVAVSSTSPVIVLTVEEWGPFIREPWLVHDQGVSATIAFFEITQGKE